MEHREIRFRILHVLYQKHYSDQLGHLQQTDKVIEESRLSGVSNTDAYADVVYLKDKGLIKGQSTLGQPFPQSITITSYGIDTIENGVYNFINRIDQIKSIEPQMRRDINSALQQDESTSSKIKIIIDHLHMHHQLEPLVIEIARIASGYRE
jgi:hypothetical protein